MALFLLDVDCCKIVSLKGATKHEMLRNTGLIFTGNLSLLFQIINIFFALQLRDVHCRDSEINVGSMY